MTGAVAINALCRSVRGEPPSPSTIVKRWATWRVASDLQTRARGGRPRTCSREDGHARSTRAAETANTPLVRTGKKTGSTQQKVQGQGVEDHLRRLGGTRVGRGHAAAPRRQAPEIRQRGCCDAGRSADACWGAGPLGNAPPTLWRGRTYQRGVSSAALAAARACRERHAATSHGRTAAPYGTRGYGSISSPAPSTRFDVTRLLFRWPITLLSAPLLSAPVSGT